MSISSFYRNVPLLAFSQAMMMSSMSLILTASALVGYALAEDKSLSTFPVAVIFITIMFTSIPASMLMQRIGRKSGFMLATLFGVTGGAVATIAIMQSSFWLFVGSSVFIGIFNGFGNYFRFAAADSVDHEHKSRAISLVMAGGVVAAIIGPNLANLTRDSIEGMPFAGSFMSIIIIYILALVTLSFLKLPSQLDSSSTNKPNRVRPLFEIARQPKFIIALICSMLGYGVMSFIMTATPLSMNHHAHSFSDTSFIIQWHVLGMFAPSFFTGALIHRFGVSRIMLIGVILGFVCVATNLFGHSIYHYWLALTLLGVGWNFLFIGGTTLLTETYHPEERSKAQAMNDFSVFTMVAIASLSAGSLQHHFGWQAVNYGVIPLLVIILISVIWLILNEKNLDFAPEDIKLNSRFNVD